MVTWRIGAYTDTVQRNAEFTDAGRQTLHEHFLHVDVDVAAAAISPSFHVTSGHVTSGLVACSAMTPVRISRLFVGCECWRLLIVFFVCSVFWGWSLPQPCFRRVLVINIFPAAFITDIAEHNCSKRLQTFFLIISTIKRVFDVSILLTSR